MLLTHTICVYGVCFHTKSAAIFNTDLETASRFQGQVRVDLRKKATKLGSLQETYLKDRKESSRAEETCFSKSQFKSLQPLIRLSDPSITSFNSCRTLGTLKHTPRGIRRPLGCLGSFRNAVSRKDRMFITLPSRFSALFKS